MDMKRFKREHERLFDTWASRRIDLIGGLAPIPLKKDGSLNENAIGVIELDDLNKFFDLCRDAVNFGTKDIPTLLGYVPTLVFISENGGQVEKTVINSKERYLIVFAERIVEIPISKYIDKHHAKQGTDGENATEALELAKDLLLAVQSVKDENLKALIIRDIVQGIRILEKWKREAESGEKEEIEDNGFDLEREQAELLEVSNRLGLNPAVMDIPDPC